MEISSHCSEKLFIRPEIPAWDQPFFHSFIFFDGLDGVAKRAAKLAVRFSPGSVPYAAVLFFKRWRVVTRWRDREWVAQASTCSYARSHTGVAWDPVFNN